MKWNLLKEKYVWLLVQPGSIGLAIAEKYCKEGAKVALIDVNPEVMEQAKRLNSEGYTTKGYILDITNQAAVFTCFDEIRKDLGPVYTLVNNAGIVDQRPFGEITAERINA